MNRDELRKIGESIYGDQWQTPLAHAITVSDRTMRRWAAGDSPIPPGAEKDIRRVEGASRSVAMLETAELYLTSKEAAEGLPIEIIVRPGRNPNERAVVKCLIDALRARGWKADVDAGS